MEPEGSLPSSQQLSTCTYPEPDQSSPQHSLLSVKKMVISRIINASSTSSSCCPLLVWNDIPPRRRRSYLPPKHLIVSKLHGITIQKDVHFVSISFWRNICSRESFCLLVMWFIHAQLDHNAFWYMKNGVFWNVMPCGSCKNRHFGGTWRLLHQDDKNWWTRNNASCN
jgi:hypothetical protein